MVRAGLPGFVVLLLHQPAVRDRELLFVDRDDDLRGHPLVRRVVRREPRPVVLLLALSPDHPGTLRIFLRRPHEEHPLAGPAVIRDLQGELRVRLVRAPEADLQLRAVVVEVEGPALAVRHLPNMEALPVELDVPQPVVHGREEEGRRPSDLPVRLVDRDVEAHVAHVERPVPGEVVRGGILREDLVESAEVVRPAEQEGLHRLPRRDGNRARIGACYLGLSVRRRSRRRIMKASKSRRIPTSRSGASISSRPAVPWGCSQAITPRPASTRAAPERSRVRLRRQPGITAAFRIR